MLSKLFSLSLLLGASLVAAPVAAEEVELPDFAIGVNETSFESLRHDALCHTAAPAHSEVVTQCTGAAEHLFDALPFYSGTVVVARTESTGAMYTISNEAVTDTNSELTIRRYLPNGFYEADGRYYFVEGNQKIQLTKQTAYDKILTVAQLNLFQPLEDGQTMRTGVIPMDQADFDSLSGSGSLLRGRFRGEVMMNVDDDGALYYLPMNLDLSPRPISSTMTKSEMMHLVKRFARTVKPAVIAQIHTFNLE